ncbi:Asp23/Gls24 family envelope stress response protein [Streptomyces sp. NPDC005573]|uniref:Asp23/Gls24 family envelope stress response protein n=1 Tax=Streptomyces sp. NPDC005573 TaxID=3156890 RepID=UPI0033A92C42
MTTRFHPPDTPPPHEPDDERLPCGRLLSGVWTAWEEGATDEHLDTCPHCRAAVAELEDLERAVEQLRDDTPAPADYDAAALTERVMNVVRLELRPGRPLPLGEPEEDMWIVESAAARTLRAAAEREPGVRAGSCRITPDDDAGTGLVAVRLGIRAPMSAPDLPGLADRVREHVRRAADRSLGLRIADIDVHITDLTDTPDSGEKGRSR